MSTGDDGGLFYEGEPPQRPDPARPMPGQAHRSAGDTERGAATRNQPRLGTQRAKVLDEYRRRGPEGATDFEMNEMLVPGRRSVSAGTRRNELIRDGWPIVDSGERRGTDTETPAIVWVLREEEPVGVREPRSPLLPSLETEA